MKKMLKRVVILLMMLVSTASFAEIKIDVTGAQSDPLPFALPVFTGDDEAKITDVIINDLERSGLFRYINPAAYIQKMKGVDMRPNFNDWQAINAQVLIYGEVQESMGKTSVSFRVFDVFAQTDLYSKRFTHTSSEWR
ncbi:MAG: Tol-Pal system protein TolB, partial [Alphaproteobacteria bacterium]|nr:Tol-Pal system protein TolB [Alphaproteobacteria bacterium]